MNAERLVQLRELFPEAFTEGKLDLKKFPSLLGEAASDAPERYGLSWSGKSDVIKAIQITSSGTLLPCPAECLIWKLLKSTLPGKRFLHFARGAFQSQRGIIYPRQPDGLHPHF
ncbi:MAG: hypothetical protein ACR2H1_14630 [Limisphaerales bacterium]